jgi:dephospho-CoA kinase
VKRLEQPGTPVFAAIVERFGPEVVGPDGLLDRAALRSRIVTNPDDKQALERIVHPAVQAERQRFIENAASSPVGILVSDIPLLYEAADPSRFDAVVLVDAPESERLDRLVRQRGWSLEESRSLARLQMPAEQKRARADYVIDNDATREVLRDRAWEVWRKLVSLSGRAAPGEIQHRKDDQGQHG